MAERLKAPVLKTGRAKALVGSNPTPSATQIFELRLAIFEWKTLQVPDSNSFDWWGELRARVTIPPQRDHPPEPKQSFGNPTPSAEYISIFD